MSESITITWPQRDIDALFAQMKAAAKYLDYDMGHALKAAAKHVLASMRTSTRRAPKFRTIREATWLSQSDFERARKLKGRNLTAFEVEGYFGRPRRYGVKVFFSRDKSTVKRNHARIGNSGLASMVWGQGASQLGEFQSLIAAASDHLVRTARRFASTDKNFKGGDAFWKMNNTLEYALEALRGGANDVSTVMERAARAMEHSIERQLVKRMGLGSLSR